MPKPMCNLSQGVKAEGINIGEIPVLADNTNQVGERFLIYTNRIDKVDTAVDDSDLIAGCNIQSTHLLYNSVAL